ncbi:MAG: PEP-CTERM sorting domain-containing protein [Burkholderiales bacterium]|nr:PEP-CTERM sorting domain-containing protein [Burkholderiales bacterium]
MTTFKNSTLVLALVLATSTAAHAGFSGNTVTAAFNYQGSPTVNKLLVALARWADQSWNFSIDVFDTGMTLAWTESTRASEPNGGNISSGPDSFSFDLAFSGSTLSLATPVVTFASSGAYSPLTSSLSTYSLPTTQSIHVGFSRMDSTDSYTIAAVPEPETYAMLLAGLGVMGSRSRRKSK